ncbi:ABC transporter related [Beutenbergia cavernae DSM 12333]|uniref:ABC transporter related n=1 Tax=Beutenbergia cavernae (strain ATCC BAA-8 / DSM 12333 / CCUG 43141 / JCM 11478 / NBRC 16432 / NCIMB 13614 / HKI 0122) TaxID=471853 RepID=C5C330_BEUC1|nr:ABC transporter ATP-binding protein [Beutenbergia cavernae]ACQ81874.1 ABC transporter related [Beutenbergia cavernae DSM 12333]
MVNSSGATTAVALEGVDVTRSGTHVLHGVDLAIPAGSITGLLGPSGAGKTTIMRTIMGVQAHVTGSVTVLGRAAGHPELRRLIGYRTQDPSVYADLTVGENLRYFASVLRLTDVAGEVDRALARVDLVSMRDRLTSRLSGGQHSRVTLAAALLGSPPLLVLDEPTVGLDPVLRDSLWTLFAELAAEGHTLLVSSHVMDEAQRCDRLVLVRDGRILADDSPEGLRAATGTPSVEDAFLALVQGGRHAA